MSHTATGTCYLPVAKAVKTWESPPNCPSSSPTACGGLFLSSLLTGVGWVSASYQQRGVFAAQSSRPPSVERSPSWQLSCSARSHPARRKRAPPLLSALPVQITTVTVGGFWLLGTVDVTDPSLLVAVQRLVYLRLVYLRLVYLRLVYLRLDSQASSDALPTGAGGRGTRSPCITARRPPTWTTPSCCATIPVVASRACSFSTSLEPLGRPATTLHTRLRRGRSRPPARIPL
jgi:hypothetical protein